MTNGQLAGARRGKRLYPDITARVTETGLTLTLGGESVEIEVFPGMTAGDVEHAVMAACVTMTNAS